MWENIQRPTHDFGDKQITFRSNWEQNYSFYLEWLKQNGEIAEWEYEPERYNFDMKEGNIMVRIGTYLPDFRVTNNDGTQYLVEVKGKKQGMRKLQRMKKYYPHLKIKLIQAAEYNALKKQVGKLLNWQ
jgi:hypothetical protein